MAKRKYLLGGALVVILALAAILVLPRLGNDPMPPAPESPSPRAVPTPTPDPERAVRDLTGAFGARLREVPLTAPADTVQESIRHSYGPYISPQLLKTWMDDPTKAPGRLVSSPWPDRIDVRSVTALSDTDYEVTGDIVEVTSEEAGTAEAAATRPVTLRVALVAGEWRITDVTQGAYEDLTRTVYTNDQYGFRFSLPDTWEGYSIITDTWAGFPAGSEEASETGPLISIRHPLWTEDAPRQDIPIMIFTMEQWEALQAGDFHIGAAPVGPGELGRNDTYVFALPARYDYAYPPGYEEVDDILNSDPLEPIDPAPGEAPGA